MKKKFFAGMTVLLSVSLFVIGCDTGSNDVDSGVTVVDHNSAFVQGNIMTAKLQEMVDSIKGTGTLTLAGVTVKGQGTVDFRKVGMTIEGTLATADAASTAEAAILVLADADITFADKQAKVELGENGVAVVSAAQKENPIQYATSTGSVFEKTVSPTALLTGGGAIENYVLSDTVTTLGTNPVYVYGKLTVPFGKKLVIPTGGKLVVAGAIDNAGEIEVNGCYRVAVSGNAGTNSGTVTIKSGGTIRGELGTKIGGNGFHVVEYGGKAYNGATDEPPFIGVASDSAVIQLEDSSSFSYNDTRFELKGKATLTQSYTLNASAQTLTIYKGGEFVIGCGKTLTVSNATLTYNGFAAAGGDGDQPKITVNGSLVFEGADLMGNRPGFFENHNDSPASPASAYKWNDNVRGWVAITTPDE